MPNPPLVFVPGLGGSFNLMVLLDWRAPTLSGWDFPPFVEYGRTFVKTCEAAGYTRNKDLFVAFFDWRKSLSDSATTYLVPWIDKAKGASGSKKVVLVGHSMGGLLARTYVESSAYRDDVEHVITLGTPHSGSPNAYFPWAGGEISWDPTATAVLNVYLWYLEHIHPFQTELNRLKTIRTQVPGVRDLLPHNNYLIRDNVAVPANTMIERNTWAELWASPGALGVLLGRTKLTTISAIGFDTIEQIIVGAAPAPPAKPPYFPDGSPLERKLDGNGDGTVPLSSAQVNDPAVTNLPPVRFAHAQLPDAVPDMVLRQLNIAVPTLASEPPPAQPARLLLMTASPLEVLVETIPPATLGGDETPQRARRNQRARTINLGHRGKPLTMTIIDNPGAGDQRVRLRGSGSGSFALGAIALPASGSEVATLGGEPAQPAQPAATTVSGMVATQTELIYYVTYQGDAAPAIRFDAAETAQNILARTAAANTALPAVLSADDTPDELRGALGGGPAAERMISRIAGPEPDPQTLAMLETHITNTIGPFDPQLAAGLIEQLRQVAGVG